MHITLEQEAILSYLQNGSKARNEIARFLFVVCGSETRSSALTEELDDLITLGVVQSLSGPQYALVEELLGGESQNGIRLII